MTAWADMSKALQDEVNRLERRSAYHERQDVMRAFVKEHGLSCFKCGSTFNDWAKVSTGGRPWAICVVCVRKPR